MNSSDHDHLISTYLTCILGQLLSWYHRSQCVRRNSITLDALHRAIEVPVPTDRTFPVSKIKD